MKRFLCTLLLFCATTTAHAQWLIVGSGFEDSVDQVEAHLTARGVAFTTETASLAGSRSAAELTPFEVVYVASEAGGTSPLKDSLFQASINGGALEAWIAAGGAMVLHAAYADGEDLPGPAGSLIHAFLGTGVIDDAPSVADIDHEYITGILTGGSTLTNVHFDDWGNTAHGQVSPPAGFTSSAGVNLGVNRNDGEFNVILHGSAGASGVGSTMIEFAVGNGYVLLDAMTFDWDMRPPLPIVLTQQLDYLNSITGSPMVTTLSATSGPAGGGTVMLISGYGFEQGLTVDIGGTAALITTLTSTELEVVAPQLPAGALHDVILTNPSATPIALRGAWLSDFADVPQSSSVHDFVESIFRARITSGCGNGNFCPEANTTRAQMAVFLLVAKHGPDFVPSPATGAIFADVAAGSFAAAFIEQLYSEGTTSGCGTAPAIYCPGAPVTRAEMAVFILISRNFGHVPPPATGLVFEDVAADSFAAAFIEDFYNLGITAGCSTDPRRYCPNRPVTRGEMAVFLTISASSATSTVPPPPEQRPVTSQRR